ncbi:DJ-1/PfpI family protein, partial [Eubacterium sp. AF15-50]
RQGKWLAAICAAPSIYGQLGLLKDVNATSYPGFEDKMDCKNYGGRVVTDKNFVTGKGLGVALEMGLELISVLVDEETAGQVAAAIQFDR